MRTEVKMIVSCPDCTAKMQIKFDRERLKGKRVTIRCAKCRHVFKTEIAAATVAYGDTSGSDLRVLVAHSDSELCEAVASILTREGISFSVCHDGQSALQNLDNQPPQVALMDVALPGLYGFEVVDKVRKRPGLETVKIILLSSVYNKLAYKRTPSNLYGADDYLEKHHISDKLIPKIKSLVSGEPSVREPDPQPSAPPEEQESTDFQEEMNDKIRAADENETQPQEGSVDVEKAQRLARIIVSDIALYNQEKVESGVRDGTFYELLKDEIDEGRRLYESRVASDIQNMGDFLGEAFENFIARRTQDSV